MMELCYLCGGVIEHTKDAVDEWMSFGIIRSCHKSCKEQRLHIGKA